MLSKIHIFVIFSYPNHCRYFYYSIHKISYYNNNTQCYRYIEPLTINYFLQNEN